MRAALLACALAACGYDGSQDAIWRGTVARDGGAPREFIGFDPQPFQGFAFGGGIVSVGYVDDGDAKLLVEITLHFADDDFARAESTAFPITLAIKDVFSSAETGMGVDYIEQPATNDPQASTEQTFHHEFAQHQAGTASGTFTVTACDYQNFMDGRLQATVMDPSRGTATRTLDLQVHYDASKND
jgi:hypothetical protein